MLASLQHVKFLVEVLRLQIPSNTTHRADGDEVMTYLRFVEESANRRIQATTDKQRVWEWILYTPPSRKWFEMVDIANDVLRGSLLTVSTSGSSRLPAYHRVLSNCRNSGPSNHLDSISFATVQPHEMWSEGLRCVGTCLQRQAVVFPWTSEMRLLTNVDNVADCWRIQCNTINNNVIIMNRFINMSLGFCLRRHQ